ncbi:XRE family transcriptional regulator [Alkalihalobacillus sp. 1P02AB]|uniref:XRE family transcriptional regulator n=1 Tax=Alkalihalobacillus sp. 1P02AB TaxID=3132260 RepID=UPI0039A5074B
MTRDEITLLFMEKKRKNITNKALSEQLNCSQPLISRFFNYQCNISKEKEQKLIAIIKEAKEYEWRKVPVE